MVKEKSALKVSRRKVLKGAALTGTMLVFPSLALKVSAQNLTPKQQVLKQVLDDAMKTANIMASIEKYGASLSREEKNILSALTAADFIALRSIRSKLALLGSGPYLGDVQVIVRPK